MQARAMRGKGQGNKIDPCKGGAGGAALAIDMTASLNDEVLLRILSRVPSTPHPCSQVCKRWLRLQGVLRRSIKVLDWSFLESGRFAWRFPNLIEIDLTGACVASPINAAVVIFTHQCLTVQLGPDAYDPYSIERFIHDQQLSTSTLDKGLKILADACPGLRRLCVVDVRRSSHSTSLLLRNEGSVSEEKMDGFRHDAACNGKEGKDGVKGLVPVKQCDHENLEMAKLDVPVSVSDQGLAYIAKNCSTLQDLELHQCTDDSLSAISACKNLQIVRLVGTVSGFYRCTFTDIGLTILARSCRRLLKLELSGCEASYDGIAAIGQCCPMLEELTLSNQGFYEGWVAALSFCSCLKALRLENCKQIDPAPGPSEHLGNCLALERVQLVRCDLRDEAGFHALMLVSMNIRELELQDCWGLEDEILSVAAACRRLRCVVLEGCSLLTSAGLETVVLAWKELQILRVVYCNNIKDAEISPDLALLFCSLKELKWRPDAKSLLSASLAGSGAGQQGGKFFKKGGS